MSLAHDVSDSSDRANTEVASRNMRDSVGYVFTSKLDTPSFKAVAEKRRPRSEYHVFISRRTTELVTFEKIVEGGALARTLARLGRPAPAVAVAALKHRPQYSDLVFTGENAGFAAAWYSRLARARIPITTH